MNTHEAIALVREVSNYMATRPEIDEAIDMAIEALRQEPIIRCKDCKHKEWFETGKIYCCELQDKPAEVKDMDYCSWGEKCDEALDGGDEE